MALSSSERVVRSAGVVSVSVMLSRLTGLVREIVMARLFGAGLAYDAFLLGFRIPNLTRDLFAEGALSSAFVPTFTGYLARGEKKEAAHLANLVATAIVLFVGAVCALGVIFSPQIVALITPGWVEQAPEKYRLTVVLTRIMFPFLLLVSLAAQAMGILNSCNQFAIPALSSTAFNIGSLLFGLLTGYEVGPYVGLSPIEGMAIGVVLGGALQFFCQMPSMRRSGFSLRHAFDFKHPGFVRIVRLMGPAILGNAAVQINVLVNTFFASLIFDPVRGANGPVSWLGYAFRFMQLPLGVFGVAIASATLPSISRAAASGDFEDYRMTLSQSLGMVFLLTVPSSVGLWILGRTMVGAIYQGGKFAQYDTNQTALALSCYAIGLAGYSAIKVLVPAFYALHDSRTPMFVSLASIVINYTIADTLVRGYKFGHQSLALSTSSVALFSFVVLFLLLRARINGIYGRNLTRSTLKVLAASVVMAAVIWPVDHGLHFLMGARRLTYLTSLALCIPSGLAVYYAVCRWTRVPELDIAMRALVNPALVRFGWRRDKLQ